MSSGENDRFASIFKLKFYKNQSNWKMSSDKEELKNGDENSDKSNHEDKVNIPKITIAFQTVTYTNSNRKVKLEETAHLSNKSHNSNKLSESKNKVSSYNQSDSNDNSCRAKKLDFQKKNVKADTDSNLLIKVFHGNGLKTLEPKMSTITVQPNECGIDVISNTKEMLSKDNIKETPNVSTQIEFGTKEPTSPEQGAICTSEKMRSSYHVSPKEATPCPLDDNNERSAKHTPSRRLEMLMQGAHELNKPEYIVSLPIEDRPQMPLVNSVQFESKTAAFTEESKPSPSPILESTSSITKSNCYIEEPGLNVGEGLYAEQLPLQNDSLPLSYAYESPYNASQNCAEPQQMYLNSTQNYRALRGEIQQTQSQAANAGYAVKMTTRVVEQQWEWNDNHTSSSPTPAYLPHSSSGSYNQPNVYSVAAGHQYPATTSTHTSVSGGSVQLPADNYVVTPSVHYPLSGSSVQYTKQSLENKYLVTTPVHNQMHEGSVSSQYINKSFKDKYVINPPLSAGAVQYNNRSSHNNYIVTSIEPPPFCRGSVQDNSWYHCSTSNYMNTHPGIYQQVPKWEREAGEYSGVTIEELPAEESAGPLSESTAWRACQLQHSISQEYNLSELIGARELNENSGSNRSQKTTYPPVPSHQTASPKIHQNLLDCEKYPVISEIESPKPAHPNQFYHNTNSQNEQNQTSGHNKNNIPFQQNNTIDSYIQSILNRNPQTAQPPLTQQQSQSSFSLFSTEKTNRDKIPQQTQQYPKSNNQLSSLLGSLDGPRAYHGSRDIPSVQMGAIRKDYNAVQRKSKRQGSCAGSKFGASTTDPQRSGNIQQHYRPELSGQRPLYTNYTHQGVPWNREPNEGFYNESIRPNVQPSVTVTQSPRERLQTENMIYTDRVNNTFPRNVNTTNRPVWDQGRVVNNFRNVNNGQRGTW